MWMHTEKMWKKQGTHWASHLCRLWKCEMNARIIPMWSSQLCFLLGVSPLSSINIQWDNIWLASLALGEDTNWMFSLRISSDCSNSSSSTQHLCCPSSRCSSRCCQRSRSNGRAIRRRGRRGWPSWPKCSLESNLLPGWKKMVSYTIRVAKVKDCAD